MFDPVDITPDRAEHVACHRQTADEMPCPMRLDHEEAKPRRHVNRLEDIARDTERAERKLAAEGGFGIMLVGPFDKTVVDVIADDRRTVMA